MQRATPPNESGPPPGTHCEWCGAEYDERAAVAETQSVARRPAPAVADQQPTTHCEWCGAEYPTPNEHGSS